MYNMGSSGMDRGGSGSDPRFSTPVEAPGGRGGGGGGGVDVNGLRQMLTQLMQHGQQRQQAGMPQAPSGVMPARPTASGEEFWAAGGSGDPNKRVPTGPLQGSDWSLVNQGYFAPMGGPDYRFGVGEGGKPNVNPASVGGGGQPAPAVLTPAMRKVYLGE
jgi:hypothetical protein